MSFVELSGLVTEEQLDAIIVGFDREKILSVDASWNNGVGYFIIQVNDG